jgi:N-acetylglucosamine kinase-like BadF-type ATPase
MNGLVVGVDAGGSSTRALAVDLDGNPLGLAAGPGANLNSSANAEQALRNVLSEVLVEDARVEALVFAAAGAGPSGAPRASAIARAATAGYDVRLLVVHSDVEAAFAAGSVDPDGTVLVAGTGAVAARVQGFRLVRRQDGHGYLLGDRGSAFWIGAAGVRAVLAELDGAGPATALRPALLSVVRADASMTGRDDADALTDAEVLEAAAYAHPPAWLGTLAPHVESVASEGDPTARAIIDDAVAALVGCAARAYDGGTLVVTGAVAIGSGLLGTRIRDALASILGIAPVVVHDATVGAAALALRALPEVDPAVADRLVRAR